MEIRTEKNTLRKSAKEFRASITTEHCLQLSSRIHTQCLTVPCFHKANVILMYASLPGEIETLSFINHLLEEGKTVFCPRTNEEHMMFYQITSLKDLKTGHFNVLEPEASENTLFLPEAGCDYCMIVPGLMFDTKGNRMGYGKGYYDKYLAGLSAGISMTTIAFSYDEMVKDNIPSEETDYKMNYIITESRIIKCNKHNQ